MTNRTTCIACGGHDLWETQTYANGGHGPALLPRMGALFKPATMRVLLCADCGHMAFFATADTLARLPRDGRKWSRVR